MRDKPISKIALFTISVGKDPIYFNSVRRYFPYNKVNFGQDFDVDFYMFTDRNETIMGIVSIPFYLIDMDKQTNTLIFFDNEDLNLKIQQMGKRLFMQPYKAEGRANILFYENFEFIKTMKSDLESKFAKKIFHFIKLIKIVNIKVRKLLNKKK